MVLAKSISVLGDRGTLVLGLELVVAMIALWVTFWIAFNALRYPELFRGIDGRLKRVAELLSSKIDAPSREELERLQTFMCREKPYLDPELSLDALANQLGMSARTLSMCINHELGVHFFDFVNGYRVQHAQELLKTPAARSNLMAVMFDSGFNSKSSFNTAFKKHGGATPSQFRRRHAEAVMISAAQEKRPTS